MDYSARLDHVLHYPLVRLSGGTVTLANLVLALVTVVVFVILARLTSRAVQRMLERRGVEEGARFAAAKISRYLVVAIGLLVAIQSTGMRLDAILAASAVLLVGIGFGLQNVAQNFVCGVILLIEQPVRKGDFVKVGEVYGGILDIGLRATRVMTRDEAVIIVPNSELITGQVINNSIPTPNVRINVTVGVAYGSDLERVRATLLKVADESSQVLAQPPPEVRFNDFGDSSLDLSLLVWISHPQDDLRVASGLRFAIDAAFRAEGIEIPFPQRVVTLAGAARELERAS